MDTSQKPVVPQSLPPKLPTQSVQPAPPIPPTPPVQPLQPVVQPGQPTTQPPQQPTAPTEPLQPSASASSQAQPAQPLQSNQQPAPPVPQIPPLHRFLPLYKPASHLKNRHNLLIALGIGLSVITVLIAFFLARQRVSFFSSAQTSSSPVMVSGENSYIFVSPISAFADGISTIRVTVFMLNNQGLGVAKQTVNLKTSDSLTVKQVEPKTDDYGRAIFDVISSTPGNYTLSAETAGLTLSHTVSISFQ